MCLRVIGMAFYSRLRMVMGMLMMILIWMRILQMIKIKNKMR
jgi:hypothetical protein